MLIHVAKTDHNHWRTTTPGEECHFNFEYAMLSSYFCQENEISNYNRFVKVRIVREFGKHNIENAWWKAPEWQDKTFWCYQTPVPLRHKDSPLATQCYALEPFECARVAKVDRELHGFPKFKESDSLIVPCDCCVQCWDETVGGVSEHKRDRASLDDVKDPFSQPKHLTTEQKLVNLKTSEDIDAESVSEERVKEISKKIINVEADPKWDKSVKLNGSAL